jgi:hypothetical protein
MLMELFREDAALDLAYCQAQVFRRLPLGNP